MLSIYVGCLVFGGILLAASAVGGHDGDAGGGHGGGGGHLGADHGHDGNHNHGGGHAPAPLLPFLTMRFWTFAFAFFGLTGALLTGTGAASVAIAALLSSGVGVGAGYGASRLLGELAGKPVGLLTATPIGREGRLLLPVDRKQPGKIRVSVNGVDTDLVAETESEDQIATGEAALIVGMRGNVALVEKSPTASESVDRDSDSDKENA